MTTSTIVSSEPALNIAAMPAYRADIDGLRALAVLSVMVFHANSAWLGGGFIGVDVFFVISGFLIGTILITEISRSGGVNYLEFWARRTRRLVPSAIVVTFATLVAAWVILPSADISRAAKDASFALLYATNWQNLAESVDYFGDRTSPSLFLHFWSLAVEEQFYIYLSLLFLLSKVRSKSPDQTLRKVAIFSVILAAASFVACVIQTQQSQPVGYFAIHTRIWQLSAGLGVVFLARAALTPSRSSAEIAAVVGLMFISYAAIMFEGARGYPGIAALLPTSGAALLIWSGLTPSQPTVAASVLSHPVLTWIGKRSYALYLWHWPVFQLWKIAAQQWDSSDMVMATALTFVLAGLSYTLIENPVRHSRYLRTRPMTSLSALVSVVVIGLFGAIFLQHQIEARKFFTLNNGTVINLSTERIYDNKIYKLECHSSQKNDDLKTCSFGDLDAERIIVLYGDSHASHWFSSVEAFGEANGYLVYLVAKSACSPFELITFNENLGHRYVECESWRKKAMTWIKEIKPDVVIVGNSLRKVPYNADTRQYIFGEEGYRILERAQEEMTQELASIAGHVVLLNDAVLLPQHPLDCLMDHHSNWQKKCAWPLKNAQAERKFPYSLKGLNSEWFLLDMDDVICPNQLCLPIQGSTLVMRDTGHVHDSFAKLVAPKFGEKLAKILAN